MYAQHESEIMRYAFTPVAVCDLTPPELRNFEKGRGGSDLVFPTETNPSYNSSSQRTRRYKRRIIS